MGLSIDLIDQCFRTEFEVNDLDEKDCFSWNRSYSTFEEVRSYLLERHDNDFGSPEMSHLYNADFVNGSSWETDQCEIMHESFQEYLDEKTPDHVRDALKTLLMLWETASRRGLSAKLH